MHKTLVGLILALLGVTAATAAHADPITIKQDFRSVGVSAQIGETPRVVRVGSANDRLSSTLEIRNRGITAAATAPFVSSFADPMHWFGTGAVDASLTSIGSPIAVVSAASDFIVSFDVRSPVSYRFDGVFNQESGPFAGQLNRSGAVVGAGLGLRIIPFTSIFCIDDAFFLFQGVSTSLSSMDSSSPDNIC